MLQLSQNEIVCFQTPGLIDQALHAAGISKTDVILRASEDASAEILLGPWTAGARVVDPFPSTTQIVPPHAASWHSADLSKFWAASRYEVLELLQACFQEAERSSFSVENTDVQLISSPKEWGLMSTTASRVIIQFKDDAQVLTMPPTYTRRAILFRQDKEYLLVGGFSGLGLELARWMARKGARSLAFLSRRGDSSFEAKECCEWLRNHGVSTRVFTGDLTDAEVVNTCISSLKDRLAGVFQMAGVYEDSMLEQMTYAQWQKALQPKVIGTSNLSAATESLPLDFFVCFSSQSGIAGAMGQANYNAANGYMDGLMKQRREKGLAGVTINIGMVLGIGHVATNQALQETIERTGVEPVHEHELWRLVEEAILASSSRRIVNEEMSWGAYQMIAGATPTQRDIYRNRKALYSKLIAYRNTQELLTDNLSVENLDIKAQLARARSIGEKDEILLGSFLTRLSILFGISRDTINPASSLTSYGLDSLVAVEIRSWFLSHGANIALFMVLGARSIRALVTDAAGLIPDDKNTEDSQEDENSQSIRSTATPSVNIPAKPRPKQIPLSSYQKGLWLMHNFVEDKTRLNLRCIVYERHT